MRFMLPPSSSPWWSLQWPGSHASSRAQVVYARPASMNTREYADCSEANWSTQPKPSLQSASAAMPGKETLPQCAAAHPSGFGSAVRWHSRAVTRCEESRGSASRAFREAGLLLCLTPCPIHRLSLHRLHESGADVNGGVDRISLLLCYFIHNRGKRVPELSGSRHIEQAWIQRLQGSFEGVGIIDNGRGTHHRSPSRSPPHAPATGKFPRAAPRVKRRIAADVVKTASGRRRGFDRLQIFSFGKRKRPTQDDHRTSRRCRFGGLQALANLRHEKLRVLFVVLERVHVDLETILTAQLLPKPLQGDEP